jgi:hypothetical protein
LVAKWSVVNTFSKRTINATTPPKHYHGNIVIMADQDVVPNTWHDKIDKWYGSFGAPLAAAAFVSAIMVDPDQVNSPDAGFYALVSPHFFMVTFIPYVVLLLSWIVSISVRRDYHVLVGSNVVYVIQLGFSQIYTLRDIIFVRVFVYACLMIIGVLSSKWMYYHFDLMTTIRTLFSFVYDACAAVFNIQALSLVVHRQVHRGVFGWIIPGVGSFEKSADAFIAKNAILGIVLIGSILLSLIIAIVAIRAIINYYYKA